MANVITWTCCGETYDTTGVHEHLRSAHNLDSPIRMSQKRVRHLDGERFALSSYECRIGDLELIKTVQIATGNSEATPYPIRAAT